MDAMPISTPRQAGIYVRRAREARGLTRAQLAAASDVSVRSLASLEIGDATGIRLDKLLAVYDALDLSLVTQGKDISHDEHRAAHRHTHYGHQASTAAKSSPGTYDDALRDFIVNSTGLGATVTEGPVGSLSGR